MDERIIMEEYNVAGIFFFYCGEMHQRMVPKIFFMTCRFAVYGAPRHNPLPPFF